MKKQLFTVMLIIAAGAITMPSCKKSSSSTTTTTPTTTTTAVFKATVNGTVETWGTYYYQLLSGGTYISAFTGTQQKVQLVVTNAQVAGTYTIGTLVMANYWDASNTMHSATTGTITISSIANNTITGTFAFVESGGVTVTNGVFTSIPKQ